MLPTSARLTPLRRARNLTVRTHSVLGFASQSYELAPARDTVRGPFVASKTFGLVVTGAGRSSLIARATRPRQRPRSRTSLGLRKTHTLATLRLTRCSCAWTPNLEGQASVRLANTQLTDQQRQPRAVRLEASIRCGRFIDLSSLLCRTTSFLTAASDMSRFQRHRRS